MNTPPIAAVSALIGDPARALMLSALMDGRARTASELASEAGIGRPTASAHLAKLTDGGLLALERQGRHRYFRLRTEEVAAALETLMVLGDQRASRGMQRPSTPERDARTCYDHLAGRLGVALMDSLNAKGHLDIADSQLTLSPSGQAFVVTFGFDLQTLQRQRRSLARLCLDWSERKNHLAGSLGKAFLDYFLANDWLRRQRNSRAVVVTPKGDRQFRQVFGIVRSTGHRLNPIAAAVENG